ncbi:MAG: transcriptional repressor [Phycisphaerales bacterium]|nr:transcriptional repressor [Phycisphaerales bacterium]
MERQTRQRESIRRAIQDADRPLSISEILAAAKGRVSGLGVATVYRTLKSLVRDGLIVQVEMPGEPPRYEVAGKDHHHHFYCRGCDRVYEVEGCTGDFSWMTPRGFSLEGHDVMLFGRCSDCAGRRPAARASGPSRSRASKTSRPRAGR